VGILKRAYIDSADVILCQLRSEFYYITLINLDAFSHNFLLGKYPMNSFLSSRGIKIGTGCCAMLFLLIVACSNNPENPASPPTITEDPQSITVVEGQTASFAVKATGSEIHYQWQKNKVGIADALDSSYTTAATTMADSGVQFRCVVSNGAGTVTSDSAVLSVTRSPSPPHADAGDDTTVGLRDDVHLDASGSTDNDTIVKYEWKLGLTGSWITVSRVDTSVQAPATAQTAWLCSLKVTDNYGDFAYAVKKVTIVSNPPVASAGNDTAVGPNDDIKLNASGSTDNDTVVKYEWKLGLSGTWFTVSRPDTVVKAPSVNQFVWPCSLKVTDDDGEFSYDVKVVTVFSAASVGMKRIPAKDSTFQMGQAGLATPVHQVRFTYDFYMDSTEVTQGDYLALMGVNPSGFTGDLKRPVEQVTWYDAVLYCNKRSKRDGLDTIYQYSGITGTAGDGSTLQGLVISALKMGYHLPFEAEWEYACRAGTTTEYFWGDSAIDSYAWYSGNSGNTTHAAAGKRSNAFGLYDMSGNVWEWINETYMNYPDSAVIDPMAIGNSAYRSLRGGSWYNAATILRSANRNSYIPYNRFDNYGFRVVLQAR
jgi:formylglycine-generating enzyme required for sulfatase activity